jgi:MtrB/PioB family decaheme-associated outer membrane protein
MKVRSRILLACAMGAVLLGVGLPEKVFAQATAAATLGGVEPWWFHGTIEAGGQGFLNNPNRNGLNSANQQSLAKFYEYGRGGQAPGPFGSVFLSTGSNNGLYQVDVWGKDIGYNNQSFGVEASKAGEQYLNLSWDQTPHLYSTSAQTLYGGVGTNSLVLPPGLANTLFNDAGCIHAAGAQPTGCGSPITAGNAANVRRDIMNNVYTTDIGIRRDTAAVEYRYTPTEAWDIRANYTHMARLGTQVDGVVFSPGTSGVRVDAPKPVNDTTQNVALNGEFAGTWDWGKFTMKLGYDGSFYKDNYDSYTVQNPFCATGSGPGECARNGSPSSPLALMSLPPDNNANSFTGTFSTELPGKSRYMGTVSYSMMRQNQALLPFTASSQVFTNGNTTLGAVPALPVSSLNGQINTLLSNNVVTTQLSPEVKTKLSYRYYGYDNNTPEITFADWVLTDVKLASQQNATYAPVRTISPSYVRQNANAEANWRPDREWNVGVAYNYERYNWTRADVNITNENGGKVYSDWHPATWITARGSWLYSRRVPESYDYNSYVGAFQWPNDPTNSNTRYSTAYRQFYLDARERNKAQFSVAIDVLRGLTITPNASWLNDNYMLNSASQIGMNRDHGWSAGVEVGYLVAADTKILLAYTKEHRSQQLSSCASGTAAPNTAACGVTAYYSADVVDNIHTFLASIDHAFIPGKFDVRLSYTLSLGTDSQPITFFNGNGPSAATGGQIPDVKTTWSRLELLAKYKFDADLVERMGWKGQVTAKLRYAWERNSVANWEIDALQSYMYSPALTAVGYMTWMAQDNPNYNVHLFGASLAWQW